MKTGSAFFKITVIFFIFIFARTSYSSGISALAQVGKSQAQMENVLKKETESFNKIKKAVEGGKIEKGISQDTIAAKYGKRQFTQLGRQFSKDLS